MMHTNQLCRLLAGRSSLASHATDVADVAVRPMPLANLFAGQVIEHGEIVQMLLKPSRWFILTNAMRFIAVTTLLIVALHLADVRPFSKTSFSIQLYMLLTLGRLMWSVVQWMGRYYILTDLRIIRLSGVFDVDVQSCTLRKVSAIKLTGSVNERLLRTGTIDITPAGARTISWQTISRPAFVCERVEAAVRRAQNGCGACL
jgi:uncharacterized membrane protein YdbT with pleckstrin-like domain